MVKKFSYNNNKKKKNQNEQILIEKPNNANRQRRPQKLPILFSCK